jgi:hypothetical protein
MSTLGFVRIIAGSAFGMPIVNTAGILILVSGLVLMLAGSSGHTVGGRRHYY